MRILSDNLPAGVRASIDEDLADVARLGTPAGVDMPSADIRLVALEREGVPDGLPPHAVPVPGPGIPVSFHDRCDWETSRQSFQLIEVRERLWVIGGGTEGVLHGFGELLQCLTGVIWGGLTDEDVLFGETRPLPEGGQSPRFAYRSRDGSPPSGTVETFIKWLSRNKYNAKVFTSRHRAAMPAGELQKLNALLASRCMHQVVGYHCMDYWMPDEELDGHPEWRGMRDGQRVLRAHVTMPECPNLDAELPIQPCYSNPDAAELIVSRMADHINAHPEIEVFSIWPHDGVNNWCQCPGCLEKAPYEHMYDLALRLLPRIPETVPIELIAYSNLLNLPLNPLPHSDRIISMLCPYLRAFRHRVYDDGGPTTLVTGALYPEPDHINPVDEREYGTLFRRWSGVWAKCGSIPAIFEYGGTFPDETRRVDFTRYLYAPQPDLRRDEADWYAENGVRYFYLCSIYKAWPDNFLQLDFDRTMWGQQEPLANFERRYYAALAGEEGVELRAALRAVADRLHVDGPWRPELARLIEVIARLPASPQRRRFELWTEYVELARPARELELAGDYAGASAQEKRVQAFLDAHHDELSAHVPVAYIRRLSEIFEQRFREKLGEARDTRYRL